MRLIDADNLIPIMKYTTTDNEIGVFPIRIGFDAIKRVIDEAPTIDAVEVVRCKDCKHHETFLFDDSKVLCWVHDTDIVVSPTDYCSYGERMQNCIDLIKQDGQDYLDERDIPLLDMAIEALQREEAEAKGYCHRIKPKGGDDECV